MSDHDERIETLEKKVDGNGQPGLITRMAITETHIGEIKDSIDEVRGDQRKILFAVAAAAFAAICRATFGG